MAVSPDNFNKRLNSFVKSNGASPRSIFAQHENGAMKTVSHIGAHDLNDDKILAEEIKIGETLDYESHNIAEVRGISGELKVVGQFNKGINTSRLETESAKRDIDIESLSNKEFNLHDSELEAPANGLAINHL